MPPEQTWQLDGGVLHLGDAAEVLASMDDASVDAVVTDPPYGLEFMGRKWDSFRTGDGFRRRRNAADAGRDDAFGRASRTSPEYVAGVNYQDWCEQWAAECLRVLKPGGYLVAFGATRTYHRLACGVEDAGFEVRDSLMWLYGSGFPKSRDVAKAIDAAAGAEREVLAEGKPLRRMIPGADQNRTGSWIKDSGREFTPRVTAPATEQAAAWQGWGTVLKPGHEPVILARKPMIGAVAANVLEHGTGALNIAGCRVGEGGQLQWSVPRGMGYGHLPDPLRGEWNGSGLGNEEGRWPPNVLLTHSLACTEDECEPDCPVRQVDAQRPEAGGWAPVRGSEPSTPTRDVYGARGRVPGAFHGDQGGGASRFYPVSRWDPRHDVPFFYHPKAHRRERPLMDGVDPHPTVKPLALMRWLVKLVTPPGGLVVDPFCGTGTTLLAAGAEGMRAEGIDNDPAACKRTRRRMAVLLDGDDD